MPGLDLGTTALRDALELPGTGEQRLAAHRPRRLPHLPDEGHRVRVAVRAQVGCREIEPGPEGFPETAAVLPERDRVRERLAGGRDRALGEADETRRMND